MITPHTTEHDLNVPDRFEGLREAGTQALKTIVVPVHSALVALDARFMDMRAARRGAFLILRGESGAGKSTFLDTVALFREGVSTVAVGASDDVAASLQQLPAANHPRIVVLEGREALRDVSTAKIEASLHAVNSFLRASTGRNTLVVWPTNTDDLTKILVDFAGTLGGESLLGVEEPFLRFAGPPRTEFIAIAERTITALNEGASLAALGISADRANDLAEKAVTIGAYLALIRRDLIANTGRVRGLLPMEQFRMWTLVVAGNEPEGDVAALTRGGYAYADIDRLMTSTGANVVAELKRHPDQLGILGTVLDARIVHVDMLTALAVSREFGSPALHQMMKARNMSTSPDGKARERLQGSELGLLLAGGNLGTRRVGGKAKGNTRAAFNNLAEIARTNDGLLNFAFGTGLVDLGIVESFKTEHGLGTQLRFLSDLYCLLGDGSPIRIEVMWRTKAGRADIANYVLSKLGNYGRAIGLLSQYHQPPLDYSSE
ncbi:hypothetical protein [Dactylosporangium sp. CA-233914]|uniref:hypothetical protein n=1 Tax=Dactylosporangium sp. CA-233914 TaxID=3239934 RepID=UPI003D8E35D7